MKTTPKTRSQTPTQQQHAKRARTPTQAQPSAKRAKTPTTHTNSNNTNTVVVVAPFTNQPQQQPQPPPKCLSKPPRHPPALVPKFACLARSDPSDGAFTYVLGGRKQGLVVGERVVVPPLGYDSDATTDDERDNNNTSMTHADDEPPLYTFADIKTNTLRQKHTVPEHRQTDHVGFAELVDNKYAPHRPVHNHDDLQRAHALLRKQLAGAEATVHRLRTELRQLDALGKVVHAHEQGRRKRGGGALENGNAALANKRTKTNHAPKKDIVRTSTLVPSQPLRLARTLKTVAPPPATWRIDVPVVPANDRSNLVVLANQLQTANRTPKPSHQYHHGKYTCIDDLVDDAHLSETMRLTLRAVVHEMGARLPTSDKERTLTLWVQRHHAHQHTGWTLGTRGEDRRHTAHGAVPPTTNQQQTPSPSSPSSPSSQPPPPTTAMSATAMVPLNTIGNGDDGYLELVTPKHGRGQVDLCEGCVYVHASDVWRAWKAHTGERVWYCLYVRVE